MSLPLKDLIVLEFSQYLSGPSAGLRLADLGARVIKIERPVKGDACRQLAIKNLWVDDSSLLFHTINRNKESFAANLKDAKDLDAVKQLIKCADILTHNFRPGVMESLGLDHQSVQALNPSIIYAEISGYGKEGPWKNKPGQDLLVQSLSGLAYTTGNAQDNPRPFGLAIADYLCGNQAVQGILAALIRRQKTGKGAYLELSLLESTLDLQFELLTTYYTSRQQPLRSGINNGHVLLSAPYGIYKTADGFLALAMMPLQKLNEALACESLKKFQEEDAFNKRDEIKSILQEHLLLHNNAYWLEKFRKKDLWAMPVMNWNELAQTDVYKKMRWEQKIEYKGKEIITGRCPIRINGKLFTSPKGAPAIGEHTLTLQKELYADA